MNNEIEEVTAEDFTTISQKKLPHQLIENILINWGGGGLQGTKFKDLMIKYAGWSRSKATGYAKDPLQAATAFNIIRDAFNSCSNAEELLSKLEPKR